MRANNLSISIPYKGCDKSCPYCVSKMTGYTKPDLDLFKKNINKVLKLADISGVTSVSITGKGEPMLNIDAVKFIANSFKDYPVEIQTNGIILNNDLHSEHSNYYLRVLSTYGVDVIAISIDSLETFSLYKDLFKEIRTLNKTVRVTLNVTDILPDPKEFSFMDYIDLCKENLIDQFSLRQITTAHFTEENKVHNWIKNHATNNSYYRDLISQFEIMKIPRFIRALPYGAKLFDVDGVSFTYFDYCIQDESDVDDIRSLIYMENGHLYTSWNSEASRIL